MRPSLWCIPSSSSAMLVLLQLAAWLPTIGAVNGTYGRDFMYYFEVNGTKWEDETSGIAGFDWVNEGVDAERNDMVLFPPAVSKMTVTKGGSYGDEAYWLSHDTIYVVITGNATFGSSDDCASAEEVHEYGDAFWVMAGQAHGPITNVGDGDLIVVATSGSDRSPLRATATGDVSDDNPSVTSGLITSRSYRRVDGTWSKNPSNHTQTCLNNGGVWNMNFQSSDNAPPVLRVKWGGNCAIPYHYHPTGALYYIQYGQMFFQGDVPSSDRLYEAAFNQGDVRWVRPGFDYGPEYNGDDPMEITVLGTDTNPMFASPPSGPYKVQKEIYSTHVYD